MGSSSDWETMQHAVAILERFGVAHERHIVSAHRTPKRLYSYATSARERGLKVIIAGAGGAAHLPGMTASMTELPVLGVPIESKALKGLDSLLSIAQMPAGSRGFGYDPIFFYPPYRATLAEVSEEDKLAVAHRGQAFRALAHWIRESR